MRIPAGMLWSMLALQASDAASRMRELVFPNAMTGTRTRTRIAQAPFSNTELRGRQDGKWRGRWIGSMKVSRIGRATK